MNPTPLDPVAAELLERVKAQAEAQPWWAKFSNTVTTAAGALTMAIWLAAATGTGLPASVTGWVTLAISVLTVLGVVKTPNGTSPSQVQKLENLADQIGRHRKADATDPAAAVRSVVDQLRVNAAPDAVVALDRAAREILGRIQR